MRQFFPKEIKFHFNLRNPNSAHPTTVFLVVRVGGKQYKFPTGVKVYPLHWSKQHEQAMITWKLNEIDNTNNRIVNEKINSILFQLSKHLPYLCTKQDDVVPTIKNILNKMCRRPKPTIDIIEVLFAGIENSNLTNGTKKNQRNFVEHLKEFICCDEAKPFNIKNFQDLAKTEVFEVFRANIKKRPHIEGGKIVKEEKLRIGFANKIVKGVRTLLKKYAVKGKAGFLTVTDVNNINLSNLPTDYSDDDNKIFLRDDEVLRIYNSKCEDPKDEIVKDLFVLECTVGFRVSEIMQLKKYVQYNENGKIHIHFKPAKTKRSKAKVDCIVYFDLARQILMKYKNIDFPKIDIQGEYNRRIKRICRNSGLTELCEQVRHYDDEQEARTLRVEKYKLVSSHTGRHSFISMMLLRKVPFVEIQRFTGHKSYDMILDYSRRIKQIDYENFEQQKREHPEQILLSCEEADNEGLIVGTSASTQVPLTLSNTSNSSFLQQYVEMKIQKEVQELKDVLMFLGADYAEIRDLNDKDKLNRLLYSKYEQKLLNEGLEIDFIKGVYNNNKQFREKREQLLEALRELRAKVQEYHSRSEI